MGILDKLFGNSDIKKRPWVQYYTKEEKKLIKEASKQKKARNKRIDRIIGIVAVILAFVSGILDMINNNKNKQK